MILCILSYFPRSPLHEACQNGHEKAMKFLLQHGAEPNCRDWRGATPFHYACGAGHLDLVTVLANRSDIKLDALGAFFNLFVSSVEFV